MSIWGFFAGCLLMMALAWIEKKESSKNLKIGLPSLAFFSKAPLRKLLLKRFCFLAGLSCFFIALADPHYFKEQPKITPHEQLAIYFILDQSGSMQEEVTALLDGRLSQVPKITLLKDVTKNFVKGRDDLIGIVSFARAAHVLSPLTSDKSKLLSILDTLKVVQDETDDGTSIGYAIYKVANMIASMKEFSKGRDGIKNATLILVTDGFQDPSHLDLDNPLRTIDPLMAARFAKEQQLRLYIINIEPKFISEKFSPERHVMEKAAEMTGGKFYLIDNTKSLNQIYQELDRLEKNHIRATSETFLEKKLLYPYFLIVGCILLWAAIFLETTIARTIP